jgi:hypothetical protein
MSAARTSQGSQPHPEAATGQPPAHQTTPTRPSAAPTPVDPQVAALLATLARIIRRQCMESPGDEAGRQP